MKDNLIQLGEYQLSYSTSGRESSPALIMIHDWMSHYKVWDQTMKVLSLSHHCIAMDLLGFGDSPKPGNGDYSITAQARRILELADSMDLEHFDLIGHSMGGQIALYLTAKLAPERVNKLISVAGVVSGKVTRRMELSTIPMVALGARLPFLYGLVGRLSRSKLFSNMIFRRWFYKMNSLPFDDWKLDREMASQRDIHISAYKALVSMRSLDLTPDLQAINKPVLAICGKQDGSVPISESQLIQEHSQNSLLRIIERCGHYPMYEQRDAYLDSLLAFLRQDNLTV